MAVDWGLDGHVTVVTGASRGLGEAAVRAMVAEGARAVAAARSADALAALADELGDAVAAVPCDMRDRAAVATLVDEAMARFGRLDSVVNNAGIAPASKFVDQPDDVFDEVLAVNLAAPAALARRAASHWIDIGQPGSVVNVASTSALKGKPTLAAYSASKGGLLRLTEALAGEWARYDIRVNVIAPGAFETDAQSAVLGDPDTLTARLRKIPVRRMGQPDELGPLVCYLASEASGFVTGACFVIDGGEVSKL
ncbi:SDR family NAD(P)-dependent oxidoreductase [Candidatus Poriferisocius sp.]|uniref:SDR family NAD(P)-dependent oxidoreductase n=1 Tax=Candidatus Poriferisocius sp. TaxID=3101276 RepID=UPI003B58FCF4